MINPIEEATKICEKVVLPLLSEQKMCYIIRLEAELREILLFLLMVFKAYLSACFRVPKKRGLRLI